MDRSLWTPALGFFPTVGRAPARPRSACVRIPIAAASNGSDCSRRDRCAKEKRSGRSRGAAKCALSVWQWRGQHESKKSNPFARRCNRPGWMFKPSAARYCRGLGGEVVRGEQRVAILDQARDRTLGSICARPMSLVRRFLPGRRPHMTPTGHAKFRNFAAQIDHCPFRQSQIPDVMSRYRRTPEPWACNATPRFHQRRCWISRPGAAITTGQNPNAPALKREAEEDWGR